MTAPSSTSRRSGAATSGAKEEAIRSDLELSPARYYQLLGRLIDTTDAQEHDPMLVKRLRRQRDAVRTASGIEHAGARRR